MRAAIFGLLVLAGATPALAQQGRFEPNQTRRTAAPLQPGDQKGILCNDDDWFVVDVPDGQRLEASIRFEPGAGDLDLEVQDARGKVLGWSRERGAEDALAVTPRGAEKLFLHVSNGRAVYDLHVGVGPSGLQPTSQGMQGAVAGWGSDWLPVVAKAGQEVRVQLRFEHKRGDLDLELRSDQGAELASSSSQKDDEAARYTATEDMTVLVHVLHVARARAEYRVEVAVGLARRPDLAQVFRLDRPDGKGNDLIELRSGDMLSGTVLDAVVRIATPYADLGVPLARIAGIDLERKGTEVETIVTVDDERLSGFLRTTSLRVQVPGLDAPVEIEAERLVRVVLGRRGEERTDPRPGAWLVTLQSGDVLRAGVSVKGWSLDLGFARMPVQLDQVQSMAFEGLGVVSLIRTDQTVARGRLDAETIDLGLDYQLEGGDARAPVRLHVDRLASLQPGDYVPSGRLGAAELQQLARALGATVPRQLLRDLAQDATAERIAQLRPLVPVQDDGSPLLERAVLSTEDLDARYAWFEVLVRCDRRARDRLVRLVCDEAEEGRLRQATAECLIALAQGGGPTQPIEQACANPAGGQLLFPLVMSSNDEVLMQRIMPLMRGGFRGGRMMNQGGDGKTKEALAEALPRLLSDR